MEHRNVEVNQGLEETELRMIEVGQAVAQQLDPRFCSPACSVALQSLEGHPRRRRSPEPQAQGEKDGLSSERDAVSQSIGGAMLAEAGWSDGRGKGMEGSLLA